MESNLNDAGSYASSSFFLVRGVGGGGGGVLWCRKCCLYRKTKEESQIEI